MKSTEQPYQLHMPIVLKSGSLILLEPSGPVQACNGNAFYMFIFLICTVGLLLFTTHVSLMLNPLNPVLNPICYLLALLGAHHFLHVSRIRVKLLTLGY